MRMKQLLSAAFAASMTVTAVLGALPMSASAADEKLTFDIQSNGKNEISIAKSDLEAGPVTAPVSVYVPSNPGVNAINLKFQINDGQVDEKDAFQNYGFKMNNAVIAEDSCFAPDKESPFSGNQFNADAMNLIWVSSTNVKENAASASEAGTQSWDSSVSWAYDKAFATADLIIPQGLEAGTYVLDIRTEKYVNALTAGTDKPLYGQSTCKSASSDDAVEFQSTPLTITVTESTGTLDPSLPAWKDDYAIADAGHYMIIADVSGAPGETVDVPVYVYGDTGTAGIRVYFGYDRALTLTGMEEDFDNPAYSGMGTQNYETYPATCILIDQTEPVAPDGGVLTYLQFTIPENAKEGTCYSVFFTPNGTLDDEGADCTQEFYDRDTNELDVTLYNGSITVVNSQNLMMNHSTVTLSNVGDYVNLTLFNAFVENQDEVVWTSSDPEVATVDQNGFVVSTGNGSCTITATVSGLEVTCNIVGVLFGDVNQNGEVAADDAQLTLNQYTAQLAQNPDLINATQKLAADVNGNGEIGADDAQLILNYYTTVVLAQHTEITWYDITKNPKAPGGPEA